ncbi:MAG: carboxyl transferase domain-containing protein, partial [Syntrophales bacterium]|nr:carboxyl transferase domain-containing protein [Syntrophales bacterium]
MEKTTSGKIDEFIKRNSRLATMGGDKMIEKQHGQGKLTARERIALLFDEGTFQETQIFVKHRSTLFGLGDKEINADGVVTGYGRVTGRTVFAAAQDFTSAGGSLGEMHAKKIWKVMEMAADARKPFIALNDSGGARIQEGITSLQGYSGIFFRNTIASGYIPQIAAVMGPTAGGAVYSPALNDFVFMVKNKSYMYLTGPDVVKAVIAEEVSHEELGGAMAHAAKSGVCHYVAENDEDCIRQVKVLLSYLPDSCHSPLPVVPCTDGADRECPELDTIMPDQANRSYDMKKVIAAVADNHEFFEIHEHWAKNMVVGFIRIMGRPVGIIANNPRFFAGVLDVNSADKSAR